MQPFDHWRFVNVSFTYFWKTFFYWNFCQEQLVLLNWLIKPDNIHFLHLKLITGLVKELWQLHQKNSCFASLKADFSQLKYRYQKIKQWPFPEIDLFLIFDRWRWALAGSWLLTVIDWWVNNFIHLNFTFSLKYSQAQEEVKVTVKVEYWENWVCHTLGKLDQTFFKKVWKL